MAKRGVFLAFILIHLYLNIEAKEFLYQGQTFRIEEENIKIALGNKAKKLELDEKSKKEILERAKHPKSSYLPKTKQIRIIAYDPSIIWKETTKDLEGNILIEKGERINPLDHISLSTSLLFFDGSDLEQVEWAKEQPSNAKWILTSGNPIELEEEVNHPVFFDQQGIYVQKFGIKSVPAKVEQRGKKLRIEEVVL
ncbi:MAG: conjugal transfer protein TraW [Rhabdochlamydiaceae bacterium]|nr:conjugal transfer protein TraW [Candidatus Amphrikana amoebophyrae]